MLSHRLALAGIVASMFVVTASAQAEDAKLTATGTATAVPKPANRQDEAAIAKAVKAAEAAALPRAVADAREHARQLARAARLKLGDLVTINNSPAGYPSFYPTFGPYGPGRFCNRQPRRRIVVDPSGRRRSVPLKGTRVVCRVPPRVSASVSLTFEVKR